MTIGFIIVLAVIIAAVIGLAYVFYPKVVKDDLAAIHADVADAVARAAALGKAAQTEADALIGIALQKKAVATQAGALATQVGAAQNNVVAKIAS